MKFTEARLSGAWIIDPEPFRDARGTFTRTFCAEAFASRGLEDRFVQHNQSYSVRSGTLRGLHFQQEPHAETKLVSCVSGAVLDVIVDMRQGSATRWQWLAVELSAVNRRQLYVPKGFAQGFMTLADHCLVNYLMSTCSVPHAACGLRYDDPFLGIEWPGRPTALSDRDGAWPLLEMTDA
jgi:dTDP-4-dehydrorhamnose 3,5-epimerase